MKKSTWPFLLFYLLLCIAPVAAQTLSVDRLLAKAKKALADFVFLEEGSFLKGNFDGWDSLQWQLPQLSSVKSFYLNRFEVSVADYQAFVAESADLSDRYDSTVWTRDYPYSYNEPMVRNYFAHPLYAQHPVVGITWDQAVRYCAWKTRQLNELLGNSPYRVTVRLPSEAEWEYAALGPSDLNASNIPQKDLRVYPWEGLFLPTGENKGQFFTNCNSGPVRSPEGVSIMEFPSDGFLYTAPVRQFQPNWAGLYQMAGNVAEWTADSYATVYERYKALLDEIEDGKNVPENIRKRVIPFPVAEQYRDYKIVKGGSWVDGPFYMQSATLRVQHPQKATCTTGFRTALVIEQK